MRDQVNLNVPNNSGTAAGVNNGAINNISIEARIEQVELQVDYIANTDQKAAAYFGWIKHILTLNAGITVLIAALAKEFFTATASCVLCLIAALICLVLAFFYGIRGLIGETDYHDAKCVGNLNDISNQERERKSKHPKVIMTRHNPFVNPKYANCANQALCFFSLGMVSLVLYVIGYVLLRLLDGFGCWSIQTDGLTCAAIIGAAIGARYWINGKVKEHGFDWQRLEKTRERLRKEQAENPPK